MDFAKLGFDVDLTPLKKTVSEFERIEKAGKEAGVSGKGAGDKVKQGFDGASEGLNKAQQKTGLLSSGFVKLGGLIGGLGFLALGKQAITMGNNFDSSMNTVQSKLLISKEAMAGLRDQAKELGAVTSFSASEAADGMGFLAQAGLDANQIMTVLPDTLNLASAAGMDLATSADIATNVMGSFGKGVGDLPKIVDLLAITSARANTSVEEMAQAIKQAGPLTAGFGVSMYEASAAIGQLANNGFKGEQAGMILKNMLAQLENPVGQTAKAFKDLGLSRDDFFENMPDGSVKFKGMENMLNKLSESGANAGDALKIFGREAGPGMQTLMEQGVEPLRKLESQIRVAGGAAEMASVKMQGMPGVIKSLSSAWEALNIAFVELGGADLVIAVLSNITKGLRFAATDGVEYLRPYVEKLKTAFSTAKDVLKPFLPYLDELAVGIGAAVVATKGLAVGIAIFKGFAAVGLLLNPVTLAITAVAAGAALIYKNWDSISEWWSKLWAKVKNSVQSFLNFWKGIKLPSIVPKIEFPLTDIKNKALNLINWFKDLGKDSAEGLAVGIESSNAPEEAGSGMVGGLLNRVNRLLDRRSPSKVMAAIGRDVSLGLAQGIRMSQSEVEEAAKRVVEEATKSFERIIDGLEKEYIMLTQGEEAARRYELSMDKIVVANQDAIIEAEALVEATRKQKEIYEKVTKSMSDLADAQRLQNIELTQGKLAAEVAKLELDDYSKSHAENIVQTKANMEVQKEFYNALVDSIKNASSIKDVFSELGNWLRDWLKDKIAHFAANKIMTYVGSNFGSFGGLFGGGAITPVTAMASSPAGGALAASGTAAATGTVAAGGMSAAGFLGLAGAAVVGISAVSDALKNMGTISQNLADGFNRAKDLGVVIQETVKSAQDSAIASLGAMGITLSSEFKDSMGASILRAVGDIPWNASEAEIARHLQNINREAYRQAFDRLGPELQAIISRNVDMSTDSVEDIGKEFERLSNVATILIPSLKNINIAFEGSVDSQIAAADSLAEYAGGLDALIRKQDFYYQNFFTEQERADLQYKKVSDSVGNFNNVLRLQGEQAIYSTQGLRAYIESQDENTESGRRFIAMALDAAPAFVSLEQAAEITKNNFEAVSEAATRLNINFDATSPLALDAADSIIELMGGLDQFTRANQTYFDKFYSETERGEIKMAQAVGQVAAFNDMLGLTGDAAIDSVPEFRAYVESLDLTTQAGREAYAQAMLVADSMYDVATAEGDMNAIIGALPGNVSNVFTQVRDQTSNTMWEMESNVTGALNSISSASRSAAGHLEHYQRAVASSGGAANSVIENFLNIGNRLARAFRVNGSHAQGLGSVPFDGYVAELHQREMVLPANVSDFLRTAGIPVVTNTGRPEQSSMPRSDTGEETREEISKVVKEIISLKNQVSSLLESTNMGLEYIAAENTSQTRELRTNNRNQQQLSKKIGNLGV